MSNNDTHRPSSYTTPPLQFQFRGVESLMVEITVCPPIRTIGQSPFALLLFEVDGPTHVGHCSHMY